MTKMEANIELRSAMNRIALLLVARKKVVRPRDVVEQEAQ